MSESDNINLSPGVWNNPSFNSISSSSQKISATSQVIAAYGFSEIPVGAYSPNAQQLLQSNFYVTGAGPGGASTFNVPALALIISYINSLGISTFSNMGIKFKITNAFGSGRTITLGTAPTGVAYTALSTSGGVIAAGQSIEYTIVITSPTTSLLVG